MWFEIKGAAVFLIVAFFMSGAFVSKNPTYFAICTIGFLIGYICRIIMSVFNPD